LLFEILRRRVKSPSKWAGFRDVIPISKRSKTVLIFEHASNHISALKDSLKLSHICVLKFFSATRNVAPHDRNCGCPLVLWEYAGTVYNVRNGGTLTIKNHIDPPDRHVELLASKYISLYSKSFRCFPLQFHDKIRVLILV
jgi:hypothetical protein